MAICPVCHVEFENSTTCPLCGHSASVPENNAGCFPETEQEDHDIHTSSLGFRLNMWGAISILSLAPLFLTLSIDIIFSKTISWSVYPLCILLSMWLYGTSVFFLKNHPLFLVLSFFLITCAMLFCIDFFSGGLRWFFPVALPLSVTLFSIIALIAVLSYLAARIGFNLVAFILFGIIVFCMACDIVLHLYLYDSFKASWSMVILAALLPTGGFFIYLHYILKKSIELKKIFHM